MSIVQSKKSATTYDPSTRLIMGANNVREVLRFVLNAFLMLGLGLYAIGAYAVSTSDWDQRTNGFNFATYGWSNPLPDILTRTLAEPFFSAHYLSDGRRHLGTDLMAPSATKVFSLCQGRIVESKDFTYQRNSGKSKYLSYFDSRLTVRCSHQQGDFLAIYMHVDGALVAAGDNVQAGQQIGQLTETFNSLEARTTGNDHLHFGVNSNPAFTLGVMAGGVTFNGYGIAPASATIALANQVGFFDPFSFLSTRIGSVSAAPSFHGAGSLINPASVQSKVCDAFGGFGCYRDEVRLHADGTIPMGVFQVGRDANHCTQVNLKLEAIAGASVPMQDIKVRVGPWDVRAADVEYTGALPATVTLGSATWNLLAIQLSSAISQPLRLIATCAGSGGAQYSAMTSPRTPSNQLGVQLADGYLWTGNGSIISRSSGSVGAPFGNAQDWAKMYSYLGNGTGGAFFQWQKSSSCSRVVLSALTDSGHYRVRIRSWSAAPLSGFSQDTVFLNSTSTWSPAASLTPVDDYFLIEVRPQPSSINAGMHNLQLKCM